MKDLSLYLLDIAKNGVAAGATLLELGMVERDGRLTMSVKDNGKGMSEEFLKTVTDPFTTTRTTRKVGMGLPLLKLLCEQTGGRLSIESTLGVGTVLTAVFGQGHIDCPPTGDLGQTVALLVQGSPEMELHYHRETAAGAFTFRTEEIREMLGPEISLAEPDVFLWLCDYLKEQEQALFASDNKGDDPR